MKRARADLVDRSEAPPARVIEPGLPLAHVAVVLVEPTEPGNVGAIARAMWNFGASTLRLVVANRTRRAELVGGDARARACHGVALLESATFHDDLQDALAGVARAFAFSARVGRSRQPRSTLEQAAARVAADRADRETSLSALVFGREDRGLHSDEVALAHELVTIPAPGADPVLNLSHAVAIALFEVARATGALTPLRKFRKPPRVATPKERAALRADVSRLLVELGMPQGRFSDLHGRIARRFLDLFDRGGAEHADFSMLAGLFVSFRRQLAKARTR